MATVESKKHSMTKTVSVLFFVKDFYCKLQRELLALQYMIFFSFYSFLNPEISSIWIRIHIWNQSESKIYTFIILISFKFYLV
jgi:hypothetical protein